MEAPSFLTAQLIVSVIVLFSVMNLLLVAAGMSIYFERKISAYIQDRIGPNRVGFDFGQPWLSFLKGMWGLGQFLADGLKMLLKEEYSPKGADKALFNLAPMIVVIPALIGFAVVPWGGVLALPETITIPVLDWTIPGGDVLIAGANINVGIIYILATASLGVYGIVLAGWASNNKYAFLGSLRASAQMISYEIPLGLSLLTALLMVGSLMPEEIVRYQASNGWLILSQPIAAVMVFICFLAEANRTPFDNAECEQELVAGFHTEYSSMRFGLFPLSEYAHIAASGAVFSLLFLGGYHLPLGLIGAGADHWLSPGNTGIIAVLLKFHVFIAKTLGMIFLVILVRWTIPRLRFDQVMQSAWNTAIPLTILIVVVTAVMIHLGLRSPLEMLLANVGIVVLTLGVLPILPRRAQNHKVRLAGSRFSPLEGELVETMPAMPLAREDRPIQGSLPARTA